MAQHIASFARVVADDDEAIAYDTRALGFELQEDAPRGDGKRWVVVAPPGAASAILLTEVADDIQVTRIGNQSGGRAGFFLHTDGFDHDFAAMTARGARFAEASRHEAYGTVAVFEDLDGSRRDLMQPKP